VKRSSHKKLLSFLQSLERKGWIDLKVEDGVATLLAINSSDRDIRKYRLRTTLLYQSSFV
jgi:hypothetical protein